MLTAQYKDLPEDSPLGAFLSMLFKSYGYATAAAPPTAYWTYPSSPRAIFGDLYFLFDPWYRRRDALYGYRGIRVGEATHPGPAAQSNLTSRRERDNSRSPFSKEDNTMGNTEEPLPNVTPFPNLVTVAGKSYGELFQQAAHATCTSVTHLFVPASMVESCKGPWLTFSNEDTSALDAAFKSSGRIWCTAAAAPH